MSDNPYAPPQANLDIDRQRANVALWNPNAAANWSLLFSPIFGAWLNMKNWEALGKPEEAEASRRWAIGSAIAFLATTCLAAFFPESSPVPAMSNMSALILLIAWYVVSGRSQIHFVKDEFGKAYPKRGWTKPLLFGVLGLATFLGLSALIGFLNGLVHGAG